VPDREDPTTFRTDRGGADEVNAADRMNAARRRLHERKAFSLLPVLDPNDSEFFQLHDRITLM
jgi:hypothetical protein